VALYEERLSRDLTRIREDIAALGAAVLKAQQDAVEAALTGNRRLANATILGDRVINRKMSAISNLCYSFLAVHLPSAGHLRLIASSLRLVNELERIGDYAATIAREALQLPHPPTGLLRQEIVGLAEQAYGTLRQSLAAFNGMDADLARRTMAIAAEGRSLGDHVFLELIEESEKRIEDIRYHFDILIMVFRLTRANDRAKNICEETLFSITGETKAPKTYDILFLDEGNGRRSRLAEAVARKLFPRSGRYASAGRRDGGAPPRDLMKFMDLHGLEVAPTTAQVLDPDVEKIAAYDVVVSLEGPIHSYIPRQPFRTVFLEWEVGSMAGDIDESEAASAYLGMYREIVARVRELMTTLRGEGAD
jgi:phosphate transport system protein